MKKADIFTIGLAIGFMVPILGVAGIIIHNDNMAGASNANPGMVYLQPGPDYAAVNRAGFVTIDGNNTSSTDMSVDFKDPTHSGMVNLVNVFSITNQHPAGKLVDITLNVSLPPGVTVLLSTSEIAMRGNSVLGNVSSSWNGTFTTNLTSSYHGTAFYLSFQVNSFSSNTGTIELNSFVR